MATARTTIGARSFGRLPNVISCWQRSTGCRRSLQAAATSPVHSPNFEEFMAASGSSISTPQALPVLRQGRRVHGIQKVKELEQKVQALDEAIKTDTLAPKALTYSESELLAIYDNLLAVDVPHPTQENDQAAIEAILKAKANEDQRLIGAAHDRLCSDMPELKRPYHQILARVHEIISRADSARRATETTTDTGFNHHLPLGILSVAECEALIRTSLNANDGLAAEATIELMKRDSMPLPEEASTNILKHYADHGQIQATERLLANISTGSPTDIQRHLHIRAHLKATPPDVLPLSALQVLHRYEDQNVPAPMHTYNSVITSLLSRPASLARAQAWDIFSHMRYVAHSTPDTSLYTLMIRACASPVTTRYSSEPEKALDLWTEMTVDQKLQPTVGAYNAVILACARSGTKTYVNEAFRLARQMLDSHRDARGITPFRPDKNTFCALLEGAKRLGDLGRVRWILAELVKASSAAEGATSAGPEIDDEVLMHVFHAYAAYNVPRQPKLIQSSKSSTTRPEPDTASSGNAEAGIPQTSSTSSTPITTEQSQEETPSFAHLPPQTRPDVIREVKVLFQRVLIDRQSGPSTATASLPFVEKKFKNVQVTSRLINSYLSVYYKHAPLEEAQALFWQLFEDHGVVRSVRAYVEALERCANTRRGSEREIALSFASQLWAKWEEIENTSPADGRRLPARLVERAHAAIIRLFTITDRLGHAMSHLRAFASKYPPNTVRNPSVKLDLQSTRTSLTGVRPLVRMTSAAEVPDDNVPPLLTFRDLEVLHHRLIDEERTKDIKYVTWLSKAYEWALRIRRDETIKARPLTQPQGLIEQ